jgi:hypothetical protein
LLGVVPGERPRAENELELLDARENHDFGCWGRS